MKRMPVMTSELRSPLDGGNSHGKAASNAATSQRAEHRGIAAPEPHQSEVDLLLVAHILAARDAGREQAARPPEQDQQQQNDRQRIREQRRDVAGRQLLGDAEHKSADDRADEGAHAADRDGDEAEDREELSGIELQRG